MLFRRIPLDPAGAQKSAYVANSVLRLVLRLQLGWKGGRGRFGEVTSAATQEAPGHYIYVAGIRTTENIQIAVSWEKKKVAVPTRRCEREVDGDSR